MPRPVVIFEDSGFENLLPLTYTRPACMLRCGIVTLGEKVAASYPAASGIVLHTRDYVAPAIAETQKNVAVNEPIDAGRFEFTVPDDVDVVGKPVAATLPAD